MKTIRIIAAGGTFDKRYNPLNGQLEFGSTHLAQIVQDARLNQTPTIEVAMQIDSLDMTDAHRATLLASCQQALEPALVLIHGTDTMTHTAQVLGQATAAGALQKTVVLTGAMVPYALENSDATFNLGFAMGAAQCLPQGVYIAMGGQVFAWDRVVKNREIGKFE
jgi:L-asparaginase